MKDKVADIIKIGDHGTTFGYVFVPSQSPFLAHVMMYSGGPLQTRVAHHVLQRLTAPNFINNVNSLASTLNARLSALPALFPTLLSGQPRGRGLIQGLPFHNDEFVVRTTKLCRERGLLLLSCGKSTVRFVPSLIVTEEEIGKCCDILESCLKVLSEDPVRCPAGLEGSGSKCCDGTGLCKML